MGASASSDRTGDTVTVAVTGEVDLASGGVVREAITDALGTDQVSLVVGARGPALQLLELTGVWAHLASDGTPGQPARP